MPVATVSDRHRPCDRSTWLSACSVNSPCWQSWPSGASRSQSGAAAKLLLGLGLPLLAAVAWGLLVAPASRRRLADPARLVVEILLFAAGTAALAAVGSPLAAIVFAIVVAANVTLDRILA